MYRRLIISASLLLFSVFFVFSLYYVTSNYSNGILTVNELEIERTHKGYFLKIDNREVPLSHSNYKQLLRDEHILYEYTLKYSIFSGKRGTLVELNAIGDTEG